MSGPGRKDHAGQDKAHEPRRTTRPNSGPSLIDRTPKRALAAAGNQALTQLLRPAPPSLTVSRHSSWEHTLIGDTPPGRLASTVSRTDLRSDRTHLLGDENDRLTWFATNVDAPPPPRFADRQWVQLPAGPWVTVGELNALGDYLPGPANTVQRAVLVPVLQRMRQSMQAHIAELIRRPDQDFAGSASPPVGVSMATAATREVSALDAATARLDEGRYTGLLARNACHFSPFNWHRWEKFHNDARGLARQYWESQQQGGPQSVPMPAAATGGVQLAGAARDAVITNGYADHFLQDSFAAGHLVNKTLVMQWYLEWLNAHPLDMRDVADLMLGPGLIPHAIAMPSAAVRAQMTTAAQPNLAGGPRVAGGGREIYSRGVGSRSSATDAGARDVTDPQGAEERSGFDARFAGRGLQAAPGRSRSETLRVYLDFLNSTMLQLGAGSVHDHFNEHGLTVVSRNGQGAPFRIGGDDTMLALSDRTGARMAAETAQLSQQAILDVAQTGMSPITPEQIAGRFPGFVMDGSGASARRVPLEEWNDTVLRSVCFNEIFPNVGNRLKGRYAGALQSTVTPQPSADVGAISPEEEAAIRRRQRADQVREVERRLGVSGGNLYDRPAGIPDEAECERADAEARRITGYDGPPVTLDEVYGTAAPAR